MSTQLEVKESGRHAGGGDARERMLAGLPLTERRLDVGGVSTAVLEGGDGPPLIERPDAFLRALQTVLGDLCPAETGSM